MREDIERAKKEGITSLPIIRAFYREAWKQAQILDDKGMPALDLAKAKEAVVAASMALPYEHPKLAPIDGVANPDTTEGGEMSDLELARFVVFALDGGVREKQKLEVLPKPKKRGK